jgi:Cdc6-like AAA superfamily ATPase
MFRILPETIKNTENYERKVREIKRKQTTMDEDQKSAFNLAINGHNLLITGQGGTGKSFLVKIIIKHLRTKVNKKVAIVCSIGIAATNYTAFAPLPSFLLTSIKMSKSASVFKDKIVQRSRQL